ncbi:coiled-coil-helix-coiled-coil-helix domain-containing protein 2-like isoform X2 [Physella acuta]|uniref:coiled-coil-helix-coiled-coil-helix domain-containing protein 2-like isoform X2 n=1 Tax=Physella acuta TaxID=109671 RepID=UPI0027DBC6CC|nr:coiled-coil-helix-coiled-coil-helix domain-containing protein 2-like isoform X2 [Physella acuta]
MPRLAGRRGGGGGMRSGGPAVSRPQPPPPPPRSNQPSYSTTPKPPASPPHKGGGGAFSGIGGAIAGSFIGSALGSVLGNAISSRMYEGRNPETGERLDPNKPDNNPCSKELDYFLTCASLMGIGLFLAAKAVPWCKGRIPFDMRKIHHIAKDHQKH